MKNLQIGNTLREIAHFSALFMRFMNGSLKNDHKSITAFLIIKKVIPQVLNTWHICFAQLRETKPSRKSIGKPSEELKQKLLLNKS